jgi:glycoprotein endo-alpha-1,2-mannosidase
MRPLVLCALLALCVPASASAGVRVSAFYYPWYGTAARDGAYTHWAQGGHAPPNDIASNFYPARGLYSSSDRLVLGEQMDDVRRAGIDEIAVSWWGRGSAEDARLPAVMDEARRDGIAVAAHLEPYAGRTVAGVVADVGYLRGLGVRTFYVYRALDLPVGDWATANDALRAQGLQLFAQTALAGAAAAAHFDGIYTYDIVTYGGATFARLCAEAHAAGLLCAPSVGPGYDARRGSGDPRVKPRRNGATYDSMWHAAIDAHADSVTITSYNEWHEGTQIEPAAVPRRRGAYRYSSYDGAWGRHGEQAEYAYIDETAYWAEALRSTSAPQPATRAS